MQHFHVFFTDSNTVICNNSDCFHSFFSYLRWWILVQACGWLQVSTIVKAPKGQKCIWCSLLVATRMNLHLSLIFIKFLTEQIHKNLISEQRYCSNRPSNIVYTFSMMQRWLFQFNPLHFILNAMLIDLHWINLALSCSL